jgi:purine-cytosine permease-like protein
MSTIQQPESDRVWSVEMNGINPIEREERHGRPLELFWIWFTGPLAKGIFVSTSLGYLLGASVSIVLYLMLRPLFPYKQVAAREDVRETPPAVS